MGVLFATLAYLHLSRRKARTAKELEFTASTSDNTPSELSKFSDLERGVYMEKSSNTGSSVVR